jgi:hypothetical protein
MIMLHCDFDLGRTTALEEVPAILASPFRAFPAPNLTRRRACQRIEEESCFHCSSAYKWCCLLSSIAIDGREQASRFTLTVFYGHGGHGAIHVAYQNGRGGQAQRAGILVVGDCRRVEVAVGRSRQHSRRLAASYLPRSRLEG